ncbi:MAG TPA: HAMP domain-containing sensor histidine kinase [Rhizomicrobium sp.]|nr:HAMP domain-containing sensor histidine kinase [Rhizomicrobium sp.]
MSALSEHRPQSAFGAVRRAVAALTAEIVRSVRPSPENAWLTLAELELTRRVTRYGGLVIAVAAFAIQQACAGWIDWNARMTWWLALAVTAVTLHVTGMRLERQPVKTLTEIRARASWQVSFSAVVIVVWCSMGLWLRAPDNIENHMFIATALSTSLAAAVSIGAAQPAGVFFAIVCHAVFLVGPLAFSHSRLDHMLAAGATALVALMSTQAIALHKSISRMLTLEHERSDLVESLRLAKQESDRERLRAVVAGRTKSQFLSNMNHELRTPMNAILGFSELIMQKAFGGAIDKYAEYAEIIHQSGRSLLSLIDDMLDLAKIEGGKLSLRESEFDIARLLADIYEETEPKAVAAQLSLVKKVAHGLPRLEADERALRQILANLMSNALKFTPPGGCITLFAQMEGDGRLAFGVDDTGIGIAEEDQVQVFERFGRGRHDVTSADKGTGLGLAIVKGFAEAHDADVKLESALGAGTRVIVLMPVERLKPSNNLAKPPSASPACSSAR